MVRWVGYIQEGGIDMVPDGEQGYHYLLDQRGEDEKGTLFVCLCWPLISINMDEDYVPIIWHREIT